MNVDAVCEKLKQIEGLDQSLLPQYCATIKKVTGPGPRTQAGLRARRRARWTASRGVCRSVNFQMTPDKQKMLQLGRQSPEGSHI